MTHSGHCPPARCNCSILVREGEVSALRPDDMRRFPAPWTVEKIPGGFKVYDANGQSLAYVYSRKNPNDAHIAGVLTEDEARRIASNIAKLPVLLGADKRTPEA